MRFKIKRLERSKHTDIVSAVGWSNAGELFSVSDDMTMLKWDMNCEFESNVMTIDQTVLDMDWLPTGKGTNEIVALACADGSFKLVSKTGRVEKSVGDAHASAIISVKWSYDGAALATAGEDGQIKLWSRGGMLRSAVVQGSKPIYGIAWSRENDSILFACDKNLTLIPTLPGSK